MSDPIQTEAVILLRQGGTTMAVHVPRIHLILTAIVNEPDYPIPNPVAFYPGPTVSGYEVEATGVSDRLTVWVGPDPFDKAEVEPEHDHRMGVLCWCGHKTPNRAVLA